MAKLTYFILHCLETPPRIKVQKEDLEHWHMAPKDLKSGKVKYLGKVYNHRDELPDNEIDGRSIKKLNGRGWDRIGYSVMFHREGKHEIVTPYDDDAFVDSDEMTWGVAGINALSRHLALEGGLTAKRTDDFFMHFTDEQFLDLQMYLKTELYKHPGVLVAGHNDFTDKKACPGFRVYDLMDLYGMKKYAYKH